MADKSRLFPLGQAQQIAAVVIGALAPACHQIQVAGSVRRGKIEVHDVDIVVWPAVEAQPVEQMDLFGKAETILMPRALIDLLMTLGWHDPIAEYPRKLEITPFLGSGAPSIIPVELYLTEPNGCNFGALMQMRTGDEHFNMALAQRAIRLGLKYKAGHGIYRGEERMDDGTEAGVFAALGLAYIPPEKRGSDVNFYQYARVSHGPD